MIEYTNEDCMTGMARYPDKYFDLAIVDPPYGIGIAKMNMGVGKGKRTSNIKNRKWIPKKWDSKAPKRKYFESLCRVSKRQIIWGGNYFVLPPSGYFAIWDKGEGMYGRDFAECEYAWVSRGGTRILKLPPFQPERIHPTQKPIALYKWLLKNYAKPNDKILDTHVGSASSLIACHDMGFDAVGFELDADYYKASKQRLEDFQRQPKLCEDYVYPPLEQLGFLNDYD